MISPLHHPIAHLIRVNLSHWLAVGHKIGALFDWLTGPFSEVSSYYSTRVQGRFVIERRSIPEASSWVLTGEAQHHCKVTAATVF